MNTDEIKASMKRQRITRQELAEKLGVSKGTVNNWLCGADPIPFAKQQLIETLLAPAPAPAPEPPSPASFKVLNVILSREEFALCVAAAKKEGVSVEDWARRIVLERTAAVAPPTPKGASS